MARPIMIQGTMSNVGKSVIAAGLCRVFARAGYRTAPFKAQNMALNSFITEEGLEMGRAQVMQAEAAGIRPTAEMNPILLKPTTNVGSQVIVNGRVLGNMTAREYFAYKKNLIPDVMRAYSALAEKNDIIVIEGAGSPAEINLKADDCFVNMGMAELADSPVILVGDIDRGGVFAQLYGTLMLLEEHERARVKGLILNKFRGDVSILQPGIDMLEEKCGIPVIGTVPYLDIPLDDEDSLSERMSGAGRGGAHTFSDGQKDPAGMIDIAVIRFPRVSNFTDLNVFEQFAGVQIRYVGRVSDLHSPDLIVLPGSKDTIGDLLWMRQSGLEAAVLKKSSEGTPVFGICGGYQMLGETLSDPESVEHGGTVRGMGLLKMETVFEGEKLQKQTRGTIPELRGVLKGLSGMDFEGYEIHMGRSVLNSREELPVLYSQSGAGNHADEMKNGFSGSGDVYGTYIHGIFDRGGIAEAVIRALCEKKGLPFEQQGISYESLRERSYNELADALEKYLDMDAVNRIIQ